MNIYKFLFHRKLVLLTFCFFLLISCSKKEEEVSSSYENCSSDNFPSDLKTLIEAKLNDYPLIPGTVIAIHHSSVGYIHTAIGTNNVGDDTAMTVDGIFDIGSVHKLFKWILLEKLYEDDLFEYSDPINNYVASPVISSGTINHLTNHSTGMTDIGDNLYADVFSRYGSGDLPYVYTYADMMAFLVDVDTGGFTNGFKDGFTLGVDYNYSSYGPLIAGEIAEELTGTDAIAQIESKIINQLDLKNTTFIGFDEDPSDRVQGYGDTGTVNAAYEFPPLHHDLLLGVSSASEGALFSTGCDMVNFAKNISDPAMNFLEEATINSRIATPIEVFAGALNVGRGVMNYEGFAGGNFWVHGGNGMHSHSSVVGYNPDNGVSAVVLANLNPAYITNNYQFHLEVLDILNTYFAD